MAYSVAVYYENSAIGVSIFDALSKKCGEPQRQSDKAGYFYHVFKNNIQKYQKEVEITIETQRHTGNSYIHSLHPENDKIPNLVFVFSKCIGVNKEYRPGDLVIIDPKNQSILKDIRDNLDEIADCLPHTKNESVNILLETISFINEEEKSYIEIRKHLKVSDDEDWKKIIENLLKPYEGKYWVRNKENRKLSITDAGKNALQTLDSKSPKPKIFVGRSECTPLVIKTSTTEPNVDVIERLSDLVFNKAFGDEKNILNIVNVCAVKRQQNDELKADAMAVGETFYNFLMKTIEVYSQKK